MLKKILIRQKHLRMYRKSFKADQRFANNKLKIRRQSNRKNFALKKAKFDLTLYNAVTSIRIKLYCYQN